jgi:hypothetical protein
MGWTGRRQADPPEHHRAAATNGRARLCRILGGAAQGVFSMTNISGTIAEDIDGMRAKPAQESLLHLVVCGSDDGKRTALGRLLDRSDKTGNRRKFHVAHLPGCANDTGSMFTSAATADVALVVVDARRGVLAETRRHSYLAALLGIRHVVVAIDKMDRVDWSEQTFRDIADDFAHFAAPLGFAVSAYIPTATSYARNWCMRES